MDCYCSDLYVSGFLHVWHIADRHILLLLPPFYQSSNPTEAMHYVIFSTVKGTFSLCPILKVL